MFKRIEPIVGVFVILMAFLFFWSPLLVGVSILLFIVILVIKSHYFKSGSNVELSKHKSRPKVNQSLTSDNRFGPNIRQIRSARRQLPVQTRTVDNYFSNYSLDSMSGNHFLQSDSLLNSMSGQTFGSSFRPESATDMSYSPSLYRPIRESPVSQLGNLPFVRLNTGSEQSYELKPKLSPVKPVTVRIAPMPQNLSKMTLSRLSSNANTPNVSTLGTTDISMETVRPPTDSKAVVDALRKSLRRKREPKTDIECDDNPVVSANKKQKRDPNDSKQIPNGMITTNKQSVKRQANDGSDLFQKRFRNNEILSSYSSLQSIKLSESLKNKRKLSPDPKEFKEIKTQRTVTPQEEKIVDDPKVEAQPNWKLKVDDERQFRFTNELSLNFRATDKEKSAPKKSYGLPLHLHSMEDHKRDRNKARDRLNRFLNAVKEVSSPTTDSNEGQISIETNPTIESAFVTQETTEVDLPTVPAAVIFTNSRVETTTTTTLLNTPISSVLTAPKVSLSPQNISVDNTDNTIASNPISSPMISLPNWPQSTPTLFTAKPAATPVASVVAGTGQSFFSVGAGSSNRRIAQNSRLRSRQKR